MRYEISYSCTSHTGNLRSINQDNFICNKQYMNSDASGVTLPLSGNVISATPTLFGVFDGLGGEECGEIASYIAAKNASCFTPHKDSIASLKSLCEVANDEICRYMKDNLISSMGTTAAMLLFDKKNITVCNIGDSKVFYISDKKIRQVSFDHVSPTVYGKKPPLFQSLGISRDEMVIEPYFCKGEYISGDKYLICSDGLTDMVGIDEIKNIINEKSINNATSSLLEKALENGGRDNITIILLEIKQKKNKLLFK